MSRTSKIAGGTYLQPRRWKLWPMMARLLAIAILVPALSGWKVTGTNVRYNYYPVSGRSHAEIKQSVRRFAPKGGYAYGLGFIDFHPDYDIASKAGRCRVTRAQTGLSINLKLPEWKGPHNGPRSAARIGKRFESAIRRHELQHVRIAERYARQMSSSLLKLKPEQDCWSMRRKAHELIKRIKAQHIGSQKAFDRTSHKQIKRLL